MDRALVVLKVKTVDCHSSDSPSWKQRLRARARAARQGLANKEELSQQILDRLTALPEYDAARTVMTYVSLPDEAGTHPLLLLAWEQGKRVVVPYCDGGILQLFLLNSRDELAPGKLGILEPRQELRARRERSIRPDEPDLIVTPGVAFDRRGGRIGYGKGYYDQLLRQVRPDATVIALAFECQLVEQVPMLDHDVPVQKIVTEQTIYDAREER